MSFNNLDELPDDMLRWVLDQLFAGDRWRAARVCHRWRAVYALLHERNIIRPSDPPESIGGGYWLTDLAVMRSAMMTGLAHPLFAVSRVRIFKRRHPILAQGLGKPRSITTFSFAGSTYVAVLYERQLFVLGTQGCIMERRPLEENAIGYAVRATWSGVRVLYSYLGIRWMEFEFHMCLWDELAQCHQPWDVRWRCAGRSPSSSGASSPR